ncbi:hypothetical protein [Pimelobacter sp. 30-1]|uniref:hypothetical protein n=1 Tax=Pimelobacter sp. 30-1 TaxID=2004991 RepID=UPI001C04714B|nr:hypothetical protein [Pimelobacter sp. 30-1]MBU2696358.1 hypothetical protein [Pimelobacter sp. 30-1]
MLIRTLARRAAAAATGGALVATGLLVGGPAPQAHAAPVNPEAAAAASWLAAQLDANGAFTYLDWQGQQATDIGSTIDLGLSLEETDPASAVIGTVTDGVDANLEAYVGATAVPAKADEAAKAAYFYATVGATPPAGIDLTARVEDALGGDGALFAGVNAYEQVWASLALDAVGHDATAADATDYLINSLKCPTGGWGFGSGATCAADPDTTALVIVALWNQRDVTGIQAELTSAVAYLKAQQAADGSFSNFGNPNANSTGMAGWALGVVGETASAAKAAAWVADHQVVAIPECASGPIPGEAGALAYDDASIKDGIADGITAADRGMWILSGSQALRSLKHLAARPATTAAVTGPTGYVAAGKPATLKVAGLRSGQTACLTGIGGTQWTVGGGNLTVALPAVTRNNVATVRYAGGNASVTVKALGAATLKVKHPARVKARKKLTVTVTVSGLAAGERVTVTVGTKKVVRTATAAGKLKVQVKVGKKKGKAKVTAVGQFANRKGKATVRVV